MINQSLTKRLKGVVVIRLVRLSSFGIFESPLAKSGGCSLEEEGRGDNWACCVDHHSVKGLDEKIARPLIEKDL